MAPELFTSGRISKSSDVYAFGILLNEILTGQRAYAGIAVPLLPHKVAVEGLRPSWPPAGVPAELRALAEACWAQEPQDRCVQLCSCGVSTDPGHAEGLSSAGLWQYCDLVGCRSREHVARLRQLC